MIVVEFLGVQIGSEEDMARKPSLLVKVLQELPDPRRQSGNFRHLLVDVVVIALCGTLVGCQDFEEIVEFGGSKLDFFRQFLELPRGLPSVDTFERLFARLCPQALQTALVDWLRAVRQFASDGGADSATNEPRVVAIDGKTLRRTFDTGAGLAALHLVSAWSAAEGLTLGQVAVADKSNEITAIPRLLELLELNSAVVTIDAAGCQKNIAEQIVEQGGDYVLALKGNQPSLHATVSSFFLQQCEQTRPAADVRQTASTETGHGRIDRRETLVAPAPPEVRAAWPTARSIVMSFRESTQQTTGRSSDDVRYFLTSLPPRVKVLARAIRSHWSIENTLHWTLDVIFSEDRSRHRTTTHAAENWGLLNRIALSLVNSERSTKGSLKCKRKRAGWNLDYLLQLLSSFAEIQMR